MQIEVDAYLSYEEAQTWQRVRPNEDFLIDPRLLDWLRDRNFDLNQPIKTEHQEREGRFRYSQPRRMQ